MYVDLSNDKSGRICLNAKQADELANTASFLVNLSSENPVDYNGTQTDMEIGVTGTLPIAKGGTNGTTKQQGYTNLIHQGNLTNANTDFNRGIYSYGTSAANTPKQASYGAIYNFIANNKATNAQLNSNTTSDWLWQIGFDTSSTTPYIRKSINAGEFSAWEQLLGTSSIDSYLNNYLPLSAGESKKLTGPLGLTKDVMYGTVLPASGFDGQLFFLEDDGASLPTGGAANYVLAKNSTTDGDASWKSPQITWVAGTTNGPKPKIFNIDGTAIPAASGSASGIVVTGTQTFAGSKTFIHSIVQQDNPLIMKNSSLKKGTAPSSDDGMYIAWTDSSGSAASANRTAMIYGFTSTANTNILRMYAYKPEASSTSSAYLYVQYTADGTTKAGSSAPFYGAVWNDYAEFRSQKEKIEPGYCVASANNGQVYKTIEKFQACDGIVSDTFGFSIGETDECKTPLAVAGRVLAYFYGNREDYHAGDTVCAGPEGKVMKMTREEIREYPDRIVGIVSEIPEYETWGSGNIAVNNRIWIKIK